MDQKLVKSFMFRLQTPPTPQPQPEGLQTLLMLVKCTTTSAMENQMEFSDVSNSLSLLSGSTMVTEKPGTIAQTLARTEDIT
jgi:hypothetical protein